LGHSKIEKFGRMANQIGDFYATQPRHEAAEGVANHIRKFWTPKMIAEAIEGLAQGEMELNATAAAGFAILKAQVASAG
jgi:formate dehydrogenase subunit delta